MIERQVLIDAGWDVRVFTQFTDVLEPPDVVVTEHSWALHREAHFATSDLVIYHFGTYYSLFNAIVVPHSTAATVVRFHNVTPPDLLTGSARVSAQRALEQIGAAIFADAVWCDSTFNLRCLDQFDLEPERVSVMELCVPWLDEFIATADGSLSADDPVRVIYVGRFVAAKGVHDLIDAIERVGTELNWALDLVGNPDNSDRAYLSELVERSARGPFPDRIHFWLDDPDDHVRTRLDHADLFVMPSYHEGFCVPVIEAMGAGCRIIGTTAGALPETIGTNGSVVPSGDPEALATAITSEIELIMASRSNADAAPRRRTAEHDEAVERFGLASFGHRLMDGIEDVLRLSSVDRSAPSATRR